MCNNIPPKFQVSNGVVLTAHGAEISILGIQVCATLHKIDLLDNLVHGGASGLILQAAWLGKSLVSKHPFRQRCL
jgi:hypothetical protein